MLASAPDRSEDFLARGVLLESHALAIQAKCQFISDGYSQAPMRFTVHRQ